MVANNEMSRDRELVPAAAPQLRLTQETLNIAKNLTE